MSSSTGNNSGEAEYEGVSVRAVELLAKAQRAADDAVGEAQAYARDLEESAREQYRQILQRAHDTARKIAPGANPAAATEAPAGEASGVDAEQLAYVRTYARVAHAQLKTVLATLNDELDQLADLATGDETTGVAPAVKPTSPAPSGSTRVTATTETDPDAKPWTQSWAPLSSN